MLLIWTAAAALLPLLALAALRFHRRRRLARIRATWGLPLDVRASGEANPHLFLLDELFRGTNAVERIAAGQAVLRQLLEDAGGGTKPHLVLAATHDLELVELASDGDEPYHFGDSLGPNGLVFDHRLQRGPSTSRNAIELLRLHGAPDAMITRAMTTAAMLDEQRARIG